MSRIAVYRSSNVSSAVCDASSRRVLGDISNTPRKTSAKPIIAPKVTPLDDDDLLDDLALETALNTAINSRSTFQNLLDEIAPFDMDGECSFGESDSEDEVPLCTLSTFVVASETPVSIPIVMNSHIPAENFLEVGKWTFNVSLANRMELPDHLRYDSICRATVESSVEPTPVYLSNDYSDDDYCEDEMSFDSVADCGDFVGDDGEFLGYTGAPCPLPFVNYISASEAPLPRSYPTSMQSEEVEETEEVDDFLAKLDSQLLKIEELRAEILKADALVEVVKVTPVVETTSVVQVIKAEAKSISLPVSRPQPATQRSNSVILKANSVISKRTSSVPTLPKVASSIAVSRKSIPRLSSTSGALPPQTAAKSLSKAAPSRLPVPSKVVSRLPVPSRLRPRTL